MPIRAVQQIMLGTVTAKEAQAKETLSAIKQAGYDGIELNGFMIRPASFMVRMMTKAAGMGIPRNHFFILSICIQSPTLFLYMVRIRRRQISGGSGGCVP